MVTKFADGAKVEVILTNWRYDLKIIRYYSMRTHTLGRHCLFCREDDESNLKSSSAGKDVGVKAGHIVD